MVRRFSFAFLLAACLLVGAPSNAQDSPRTYVIVHGAWGSITTWLPIERGLEGAGHRVFLASLTGLGDRAHLRRPDIDLETHIQDVVNLIEARDLTDIYLVGHSYGGMVITGVWDRVRSRIDHVIYLDAFVPEDGRSLFSYSVYSEDAVLSSHDDIVAIAAQNDGWVPIFAGRREVPDPRSHPLHTFIDPLVLTQGALPGSTKRTYIRAIGSDSVKASPVFDQFAEAIQNSADWNYFEIETGHVVQREDPDGLVRLLLDLE